MRLQIHPRTVIINVITALVFALIFEAIISFGLRNPHIIPGFVAPYFQDYYLSQDRKIIQVTECAQYDSELFYMLKPGDCAFKNREFDVMNSVNSAGLRDDQSSLEKPSIVALGDSFTMGWGIPQDKTFSQVLENTVNKKVLNAGMSSFGTAREMILLERLNLSGLDQIIIQYHPNDFEENQQYVQEGFHLRVRTPYSYDSLKEAINGRTDYFVFKHLAGVSKSFALQLRPRKSKIPGDTVQAQMFLKILKHARVGDRARQVVVFKIDKYGENTVGFENAVDHLLTQPEFSGMNIKTVRIGSPLESEDYFILDDHINENGHAKLAHRLQEYFDQEATPVLVGGTSAN
jgi:hypothetical protein